MNTLTNVKDVKIAQRALEAFTSELVAFKTFSTNCSAAPADKYEAVKVPIIGAAGASQDFTGTYLAGIDSDVDARSVILNRHKFQTAHMTARELAETSLTVEQLVVSKAKQLAEDVMLDVTSLITAALYGAPAIPALAASGFDYKKVLAVREACGNAKMPRMDRAMILDSAYYTSLLADDVVAKSFNLNLAGAGVQDAVVSRIAGFNLYETGVLPSDHAEKLVGFAVHPSAICLAMRYLPPAARYDEAGAVTDPQTGLTIGYLRYTETSSNRVFITLECLYGFKEGIPAGLKRIVKP